MPDQVGNQPARVQSDNAKFRARVSSGSALDRVSLFGRYTLDFPPRFVGNLVPRSLVLPGAQPGVLYCLGHSLV